MKRGYIFFLFFFIVLHATSQTPDFSLYGYAAMEGGTSGGAGGPVVTPASFAELQNYCAGDQPYIILIDREFKGPNVLKIGSNKTILGLEDKAFINQIGFSINSQHNIIIRNIRFTMTGVPITNDGENKIAGFNFDPDCIAIQADDDNLPESERKTHHIWIDHCEFYNEDPTVMTDYDRYDGLLDIKNDCQYITISWNYFHDHHKASLSGKGNSDNFDRKTTMHHNKFEAIESRMPLLRYGKLHMLNNYLVDCPDGNGLNVRIQSNAYVEKNYFDNVKKPIFGKMSEGGRAHLLDNRFVNCGRLSKNHLSAESPDADVLSESEEYEDTDYVPPYLYDNITYSVNDVPAIVNQYAGIGKIESFTNLNSLPQVILMEPGSGTEIFEGGNITLLAQATDSDGQISEVSFYANGNLLNTLYNEPFQYQWQDLQEGEYLIKAEATDNEGATGISEVVKITVTMDRNIDCSGVENGTAFLDDCGVCVGGTTGFLPCAGDMEAEKACLVDGVQLETDNPGFSGQGYVNTENTLGSSIGWKLISETNQQATLTFRYANGGGASRNGNLIINGQKVSELALNSTGSWESWDLVGVNIDLLSGVNEIMLEALTNDGLANIDIIYFSDKVREANCSVITSIDARDRFSNISIYPNPTTGMLYLSENCAWKILSLTGTEQLSGLGEKINISDFNPGYYFLQTEYGTFSIIKN